MATYGHTWPALAKQWDSAQLTRQTMAMEEARTAFQNKSRYERASQMFAKVHPGADVPWWFIAAIHYREASFNFDTQLAQGDPLDQISHNVPAGQGPYHGPDAWERATIIALEGKHLQHIVDWSPVEKSLFWWEEYNGEGYRNKGVPSAYVWAGTSVYHSGFFPRDHVWDPTAADPRVGCAAILMCLMQVDPTIKLVRESPTLGTTPAPQPEPPTMPPVPAPMEPQIVLTPEQFEKLQKAAEPMWSALGAWLLKTIFTAAGAAQAGTWGAMLMQALAWLGTVAPLPGMAPPSNTTMAVTGLGSLLVSGLIQMVNRVTQTKPPETKQ